MIFFKTSLKHKLNTLTRMRRPLQHGVLPAAVLMTCLAAPSSHSDDLDSTLNDRALLAETQSVRSGQTLKELSRPVSLKASLAPSKPTQPGFVQALSCDLGTANECFTDAGLNPVFGTYMNVGAFFDRRQPSSESHFMLKLFTPEATGRIRVNGMGFFSRASGLNSYRAAGVVVTDAAAPAFPTREQLIDLGITNIQAAANGEVCIGFGGNGVDLDPGQAAWLILRFETRGSFVGVLIDRDSQDEECDFMTPDAGNLWYRPAAGANIDWAITAFAEPVAAKDGAGGRLAPELESWSNIKRFFR